MRTASANPLRPLPSGVAYPDVTDFTPRTCSNTASTPQKQPPASTTVLLAAAGADATPGGSKATRLTRRAGTADDIDRNLAGAGPRRKDPLDRASGRPLPVECSLFPRP